MSYLVTSYRLHLMAHKEHYSQNFHTNTKQLGQIDNTQV